MQETQKVPAKKDLSEVYFDRKFYPRVQVNEDLVARYAAALRNGVVFPPIDATMSGVILDGIHRYLATRIVANEGVGDGTIMTYEHDLASEEEIMRFAVESNCRHGANLTEDDFRFISDRYPALKAVAETIMRFGFLFEEEDDLIEDSEEVVDSPFASFDVRKLEKDGYTLVADTPARRTRAASERSQSVGGSSDGEEDSSFEFGANDESEGNECTAESQPESGASSQAPAPPQLCSVLGSLGMRGLMTRPTERMLCMLTVSEQKLLVSKLDSNLDAVLQLGGSEIRDLEALIEECRNDGIEGEDLVDRMLASEVFTTGSVSKSAPYDKWTSIKLRVAHIREQIQAESANPSGQVEIIDWIMSQFTELLINKVKQPEHVTPHTYDEFPELVKTRSVEIENGIM